MSLETSEIHGSILPRIFTPPLIEGPPGPCGCGCALTPETSYGFDVEVFARDVVRQPLDPWERWAVIHGGELLPDGRPRFRQLLVLVARQNGKTELCVILALFWMFVDRVKLVLGTSTNIAYAKEPWDKALQLIYNTQDLAAEVNRRTGVRQANGEQMIKTDYGSRYKIAASNRRGGRSLTIDRLIADELREHDSWDAYNAAMYAMNAVRDAQAWLISNQGDERAVVLDSLRSSAIEFIETGEGDYRLGLLEWSAPEGSRADDPQALARANPNVGYRLDINDLLSAARRALAKGGEELAGFKTEVMCMRVPLLDPAIDPDKWVECLDVGDLADVRSRVALCLDISMDELHATLVAAAVLPDERVRVEVVAAWEGQDCIKQLRKELPGIVRKVKPRVLGWFPNGPAAAFAADMADSKQNNWPPSGISVEGIKAEVTAVCMGYSALVTANQIAHSDDPLLNAQTASAEKLHQGDAWRFTRKGAEHCDSTYAAAGATHLARTLPESVGKPRIITSSRAR